MDYRGRGRCERFRRDRFPIFLADSPTGLFYGLPALDAQGLKVAQHYGAPEVRDPGAWEDWASPHLDVVARREGYRKALPTLLDLASARSS